jgi:hypothetical protein
MLVQRISSEWNNFAIATTFLLQPRVFGKQSRIKSWKVVIIARSSIDLNEEQRQPDRDFNSYWECVHKRSQALSTMMNLGCESSILDNYFLWGTSEVRINENQNHKRLRRLRSLKGEKYPSLILFPEIKRKNKENNKRDLKPEKKICNVIDVSFTQFF